MPEPLPWGDAGCRYYRLSRYFRRVFGGPTWKVSVDAGFGCPNADGTLASGGCVFCNIRSFSPSRRLAACSLAEQIVRGTEQLRRRYGADRFVAYFQPATNTYAPVERLRAVYEEALRQPGIVGLAIGTRPDCVPDDVLDLLAELSQRTWLSVEYGLQTIHDRSLDWMNRGHHYDVFLDAVRRSRLRGLHLGVHLILGLPQETRDDILATAREVARLRIESVKLHNLYAVQDTRLARAVAEGSVQLLTREEYVGYVVDFLEQLAPDCVIDRLSGDAPPQYLVAPRWCLDRSAVRAAVERELERRGTWQGRRCSTPGTLAIPRESH